MRKTALAIGTVAIVTLGSTFFSNVTHAETLQSVQNQQEQVKAKLSKAEADIADILYEIKDINEEIAKLQYALEENKKQIDKTEEQISGLEDEIDELNEKIEQRNEILKTRIASYQDNGGKINYLDVILGAEGFNEFISRVSAVTTITNADMELLEENEKDKAAVEEKLIEQEELAAQLEEQNETIEIQKEQQNASKKKLKEKEEKLKKDKAKLESESSDLAALEAEIRASIITPATPQVAAETTSSGSNSNSTNANSSNASNSKASTQNTTSVPYTGGGGSAIAAGRSVIGTPYVWGGSSTSGFDCSGFVQWAYNQEGVSLPRTASAMASAGKGVSYSEAKPGDLVIFRGGGHVGIYLGGGKFLGAQNSTGVAIADMNSGYWKNNFDGIVRRVK